MRTVDLRGPQPPVLRQWASGRRFGLSYEVLVGDEYVRFRRLLRRRGVELVGQRLRQIPFDDVRIRRVSVRDEVLRRDVTYEFDCFCTEVHPPTAEAQRRLVLRLLAFTPPVDPTGGSVTTKEIAMLTHVRIWLASVAAAFRTGADRGRREADDRLRGR